MDPAGNGLAVWSQHDDTEDSIWVNRYDLTTTSWRTSVKIESDSGQTDYPQPSIDDFGDAWSIWQQE